MTGLVLAIHAVELIQRFLVLPGFVLATNPLTGWVLDEDRLPPAEDDAAGIPDGSRRCRIMVGVGAWGR